MVFDVLVELLSFVVNEGNPRVENDLFFSLFEIKTRSVISVGLFTFLLQFSDTGSEILQLCFTAATTNVFVDFRDSFRVAGHRRGSNAVKSFV